MLRRKAPKAFYASSPPDLAPDEWDVLETLLNAYRSGLALGFSDLVAVGFDRERLLQIRNTLAEKDYYDGGLTDRSMALMGPAVPFPCHRRDVWKKEY